MSQAKVDRYKEEKQKREKLQKKEKRELLLWKIVGIIVLVALVGWIGFSVYQNVQKDASHTYEMKTDALDHYMNGLNAETETSSEASTETTEKTTEETAAETSAESTVTEAEKRNCVIVKTRGSFLCLKENASVIFFRMVSQRKIVQKKERQRLLCI